MSSILSISDFEAAGRFQLSLNSNNEDGLQAYIDEVQEDILNKLLGCELAALFITDLTAAPPIEPQTDRFKDIFDPFCEDIDCGQLVSKGMKVMLQGLTFWYYFRDNLFKRTTSGPKKNQAETSDDVSMSSFGLASYWNNAEDSYSAIQYYICNVKPEDYPEYNGVELGIVSPF